MAISKQEALAELARRELNRRASLETTETPEPQSLGGRALGALDTLGRDAIDTTAGFAEGFTAGIPRTGLERLFGTELPRGNIRGQIAGTVVGPGKVASGAAKLVKAGGRIVKPIAQGVASGATLGALLPQEDAFDVGQRATSAALTAGIGGVAGGLVPLIRQGANAVKVSDDVFSEKFTGTFKKLIRRGKTKAGRNFSNQLDEFTKSNPDKTVNVQDELFEFIGNVGDDVTFSNLSKRVPQLKRLVDNPDLSTKLTLRDTQELINGINSKLPKRIVTGDNVRFLDLDMVDFVNKLKLAQSRLNPQMAKIRGQFKTEITDFSNAKNLLKTDSLETAARTGFKGSETRQSLRRILGKKRFEQLEDFGKAKSAKELAKNVVAGGANAITTAALIRLFLGRDR